MHFQITEAPIASDDLYDHVLDDGCGAVATFCGVVRDNSGSKRTDYLEYEAYPEMAEKKMAELGREAMSRWDIADVAIIHRTGYLEIGEISVLIAVASPHRGAAFEACHWVIDRLKETVPIWKKEVGEDGQYWVEGPTASTAASG